jgi:hypothetical protein
MLFPTHLVAGYLLTLRWDRSPYWAVGGAALPDVVDKSVSMTGFYGLYHSAGHSLLALAGALVVLALGRAAVAVWLGWASHLALDATHVIVNARPADVRFLAWPVVEYTPAVTLPPVEFAVHYLGTPSFYVEVLIWGIFAAALYCSSRWPSRGQ